MKNKEEFKLSVDFVVADSRWSKLINRSQIKNLINTAITQVNFQDRLKNAKISMVFGDNNIVKELNKTYRHKDKETNILALVANNFEDDKIKLAMAGKYVMLGEIFLALDVIKEEAMSQNKSFADHMSHLIIHATLHLLGYNHDIDEEAEKMENLEIAILQKFDISSPYIT